MRFEPGEVVVMRHFQHEKICGLHPLRVVEHHERGLLLWAEVGTRFWHQNMPDGRHLGQTPLAEWVGADKVPVPRMVGHGLLSWHPVGADYSIRFFFDADGTFRNWYANLELPAVTWRDAELAGLDTVDWDLDVVVAPDRSWRWKDEEEFDERLRSPGLYWVDDEARVRAAGQEVVALVEAGAFPFDGTWTDFRPDPVWPPIVLSGPPDGWRRPRAC